MSSESTPAETHRSGSDRDSERDPSPSDATAFPPDRRTWEMELLISGAVVFALLRLPERLIGAQSTLELHLGHGQRFGLFFAFTYLTMICYVLIAAFVVHLVTRAYWIGMLGLDSVFPNGIDYDALPDGSITRRAIRELPSVRDLARSADRLASSIFSFAFLFVFFFLLSIVMASFFGIISFLLSQFLLPDIGFEVIFFVLLAVFALPPSIVAQIDKSYRKKGQEPPESMRRVLEPMIRFNLYSTRARYYMPIYYTLVSRLKRKRAYPLLVLVFLGIFVYHFGSLAAGRSSGPLIHGYHYMPPNAEDRLILSRYYEDRRPEEGPYRYALWPSIDTDVVEGPYLRLYLPYAPAEDNPTLESHCSDIEPWPWSSERAPEATDPALVELAIGCLADLYHLQLDGEPLVPEDFDLYQHPITRARGLVTYLPTRDLAPGRHLLSIREVDVERETPHVHSIPFWR